jgi:hypothetical protein
MKVEAAEIVKSSKGDTKVVSNTNRLHVSVIDGEPMLPTGARVKVYPPQGIDTRVGIV